MADMWRPPSAWRDNLVAIERRTGLILPVQDKVKRVRNPGSGRILPCCWDDCMADGDNRHRIATPHEDPKWPGEKLIYIFCSERHRDMYRNAAIQRMQPR